MVYQLRQKLWVALLVVVGLPGLALGLLALPPGTEPVAAQAQVDGATIYQERCAFCHGENGDGNGPVAPYLNPRPRDFTSGQFKFRTTASGELPLREDVINIVKNGVRGTAMPRWEGFLTQAEIEAVVDYVTQNFVPDWGSYEPTVIPVGRPPRANEAIISEGEQIYQELQCWRCHGQAGHADGPSAPTLTDEFDFPIRAADLTKEWRYKGGSDLADIFTRFSTGMNGTPMPSFYDVFPEEEREEKLWALSAYVHSLQTNQPTEESVVTAEHISGPLPALPDDPVWDEVEPVSFYLTGQVIAAPRWQTPGVDAVTVRALYNDESLALLVQWNDPFEDGESGGSDVELGGSTYVNLDEFSQMDVGPFPDTLAVQFPQNVPEGTQKPYLFRGQPGQPVNLWRWQAGSSVAEFNATGFQEAWQPQEESQVTAVSTWADGQYRVLFTRSLTSDDPNDVQMVPGEFIPIAFQAWEGSNGEAGMRLSLSSWYSLVLAKPAPLSVYIYTVLTVALVAGGEWLLVRRARGKQETV